jgi:hypothetical protein
MHANREHDLSHLYQCQTDSEAKEKVQFLIALGLVPKTRSSEMFLEMCIIYIYVELFGNAIREE